MVELRDLNSSGAPPSLASVIAPFSAGLSADAVASAKSEAGKLVDSVKSGGFTITEEGVKPMLDAIRELRGDLQDLQITGSALEQAPQLGSHPYGYQVATHVQKGGSGQPGSANVVLEQFDTILQQVGEALERASGRYQGVEEGAQDSLKKPLA
jgi:hypothetical protein